MRKNKGKPTDRSISAIKRLTLGWEMCMISAASVIDPLRMVARKASS